MGLHAPGERWVPDWSILRRSLLCAATFVALSTAIACSGSPPATTYPAPHPSASAPAMTTLVPTAAAPTAPTTITPAPITPAPTTPAPTTPHAAATSTAGQIAPSSRATDARPFDVFVPTTYDGLEPMPLVILLHWLGATGDQVEAEYKVEAVAEEQHFLYVHPNGTVNEWGALSWNATDACCNSSTPPVDDSSYLASVIRQVKTEYNVDAHRVFVLGISNGGFMAYRMACDHADEISAIVSIVGATFLDSNMCHPTQPVSVLEIHGTADDTVPYEGGQFAPGSRFPGSERTVADWAALDGCAGERQLTGQRLDLESGLSGNETRVSRFDGCPAGIGVELWVVEGGSHALRITPNLVPEAVDFLLGHPRP